MLSIFMSRLDLLIVSQIPPICDLFPSSIAIASPSSSDTIHSCCSDSRLKLSFIAIELVVVAVAQ